MKVAFLCLALYFLAIIASYYGLQGSNVGYELSDRPAFISPGSVVIIIGYSFIKNVITLQ